MLNVSGYGVKNAPISISISSSESYFGGEGTVYFSADDKYAVKIYHENNTEKESRLQKLLSIGSKLSEEESRYLCWPKYTITKKDQASVLGVVTEKISGYQPLQQVIHSPKHAVKFFGL